MLRAEAQVVEADGQALAADLDAQASISEILGLCPDEENVHRVEALAVDDSLQKLAQKICSLLAPLTGAKTTESNHTVTLRAAYEGHRYEEIQEYIALARDARDYMRTLLGETLPQLLQEARDGYQLDFSPESE